MRAYVLEEGNSVPVLREDVPEPTFGEGEVLVRVKAASIHPVDLQTCNGGNAMVLPLKRPFVPGCDFAGQVEAVGAGVVAMKGGDKVYGYAGVAKMGAYAEKLVLRADEMAVAPEGLDFEALATLPLPAICALQAIESLKDKTAKRVLVHGGNGGVGRIAVQVYVALGWDVAATASSGDIDAVKALGATQVVDYKTKYENTLTDKFDLVLDTVGGDTCTRSLYLTKAGGTVASICEVYDARALKEAGLAVPTMFNLLLPLKSAPMRFRAWARGVTLYPEITVPSGALLAQATKIAEGKSFSTLVAKTFPFSELPDALEFFSEKTAKGRVVITST